MKQKILEALKQGHKNLGLSDEAFERVADLGVKLSITEEGIANFVKGAEDFLKSEQREADKVRTEKDKRIKELEAQLEAKGEEKAEGVKEDEPVKEAPQGVNPTDFAKIIADAVAQAVNPLKDELAQFKGVQAHKEAIADASARFNGNDWVKKYPDEAEDAWERAVEINTLGGNKMTADELHEKAMGYFGKAVKRKGEDISKPFKSEGGGEGEPDFSPFDRAVAKMEAAKGGVPKNEGASE